jgi:hypothetical protein
MISIKDIIGDGITPLWIPCPKCKMPQPVTEWGEITCAYEKCDGHKFMFEFNLENLTLLLKKIKDIKNLSKSVVRPMVRPSMPKLQKTHDCYILVPQPPSSNPDDWYFNDPFKK